MDVFPAALPTTLISSAVKNFRLVKIIYSYRDFVRATGESYKVYKIGFSWKLGMSIPDMPSLIPVPYGFFTPHIGNNSSYLHVFYDTTNSGIDLRYDLYASEIRQRADGRNSAYFVFFNWD